MITDSPMNNRHSALPETTMPSSSDNEPLVPDLHQAERFLTMLGETCCDWTFQTFDDATSRSDRSLARIFHGTENDKPVCPQLAKLNQRGAGVFVMINRGDAKGRTSQNVTEVRAVFVDLDGARLGVLDHAPLEPHIVVESSPGRYHAYWRIEALPLSQFAMVQLALAQRFGGDPSVKDLPRVMRMPGFFHQKGAPFKTRIIRETPYQPYQVHDFLQAFGIDVAQQMHTAATADGESKVPQGGRNNYLTSQAGAMQRRGMSQTAIAAALQEENRQNCDPPLHPDEVARIARSSQRYPAVTTPLSQKTDHGILMRCLADVTPSPIEWLWPLRIPLGKVTLIAGDPGLGKSLLTLDLAAHVSRGTPWPVDDAPCPCSDVLLLSAEDDVADTIRPRLDAANADPKRVHVLEAVFDIEMDGKRVRRLPTLVRDIERLDKILSRGGFGLVVVDPVSAYLGGVDTHQNANLRAVLAPLAEIAMRHRVAIICVSHLNKGAGSAAIYRTNGSIAYVAAARAAYIVIRDKDDGTRRLMLPVKNNLAEDQSGLAYRVQQSNNGSATLVWEDKPVTISADDALAPAESSGGHTELNQAADWLQEVLAQAPASAREIRDWAEDAGHAWRTVRRAKEKIGVVIQKSSFDGGWTWSIPPKVAKFSEGGQATGLATLGALATFDQSGDGRSAEANTSGGNPDLYIAKSTP